MSEPQRFPLHYPGDVRPSFVGDTALRRLARQLPTAQNGRVLGIGVGAGPLALFVARDLNAQAIIVDTHAGLLAELSDRIKAHGLEARVSTRQVDSLQQLPFKEGEFNAVLLDPCAPSPLTQLLKAYRTYLAPKGRLLATYPVRVGRTVNAHVARFWEAKLGEPLILPRDVLQHLERAGYEPQTVEALEDRELDEFYRQVEQHTREGDDKIREEISLHRSQAGRSTASFAVLVGRRKEPGEKPPPSRNE